MWRKTYIYLIMLMLASTCVFLYYRQTNKETYSNSLHSSVTTGIEDSSQQTTQKTDSSIQENQFLFEYRETVYVDGTSKPITLSYYTVSNEYFYDLIVDEYIITEKIDNIFIPETSEKGFEVCDVNQDGNDDVIIRIGVSGQSSPAHCYLYTSDNNYTKLAGFENLMIPHWSSKLNMIIEEWHDSPINYKINHYSVVGEELILMERLSWQYINGGYPRYTEEKRIDNSLKIIKDSVPERDIDLEYWYAK